LVDIHLSYIPNKFEDNPASGFGEEDENCENTQKCIKKLLKIAAPSGEQIMVWAISGELLCDFEEIGQAVSEKKIF